MDVTLTSGCRKEDLASRCDRIIAESDHQKGLRCKVTAVPCCQVKEQAGEKVGNERTQAKLLLTGV